MISEVENIKKGLVVSTVDFDTSKKIIGVATSNLVPAANGIAPLEKQGAFQVQNVAETIDLTQALNTQSAPTEQIAVQNEQPVLVTNTEASGLKMPVTSDVISESPVQVENPSNLTGFDMPSIEPVQEEVKEDIPTEPVAIDIQMPEMPSVIVADEPNGVNESLFEGATEQPSTSILEETILAAAEQVPPQELVEAQAPVQEQQDVQVNIEMPTIPVEQPVAAEGNIMEAIPTTAPAEEIPTFDIEMPAIGDVAETEITRNVPDQVEQPMQETIQLVEENAPAVEEPKVEEKTPVVSEEVPLEQEETTNEMPKIVAETNVDEILKTYKESMEAIISNFNKAQIELLNECVGALKKMQSVKKEEINQEVEKAVEQQPVQEPVPTVVQQSVQPEIAPGNPLESAAFEIIDAMSAPKM